MVDREEITPDIESVRQAISSAQMVRNPSGSWTLILEIGAAIRIDEHRKAGFFGELRIQGAQTGRRPNPPRKLNTKGQFAKKKARKA